METKFAWKGCCILLGLLFKRFKEKIVYGVKRFFCVSEEYDHPLFYMMDAGLWIEQQNFPARFGEYTLAPYSECESETFLVAKNCMTVLFSDYFVVVHLCTSVKNKNAVENFFAQNEEAVFLGSRVAFLGDAGQEYLAVCQNLLSFLRWLEQCPEGSFSVDLYGYVSKPQMKSFAQAKQMLAENKFVLKAQYAKWPDAVAFAVDKEKISRDKTFFAMQDACAKEGVAVALELEACDGA